jgi:hypothetical protein
MIMAFQGTIGAIAMAAALLMAVGGAQAFDESRYPDWSGQWRRVPDGGPPRYDPSKPNGRGQEAPLKEPYRLMHEASMADQLAGGQGLYRSSVRCVPMGMPWQMNGTFPFEFIFTDKTTFVLSEISTQQPRRIYTDGRAWPKDEETTFTGYSIGRWIDEGGTGRFDVLEIETRNLRVPRIYDQTGIPFHEDGQTVIKERIFLDRAKPNILHDQITTTDNALTHPWTVMKNFARLPTVVWTENNCAEGNDNVAIGKEDFLLGADGYLMPTRKDQAPPDLRYFKQPKK